MKSLLHLLASALAVLITAYIVPSVYVSGFFVALVVAVVLGILNIFVRPILLILTLPINILTLGLFTFVINTLLILLASAIVPGFRVGSFFAAMIFGIVLAIVSWFLNKVIIGVR